MHHHHQKLVWHRTKCVLPHLYMGTWGNQSAVDQKCLFVLAGIHYVLHDTESKRQSFVLHHLGCHRDGKWLVECLMTTCTQNTNSDVIHIRIAHMGIFHLHLTVKMSLISDSHNEFWLFTHFLDGFVRIRSRAFRICIICPYISSGSKDEG